MSLVKTKFYEYERFNKNGLVHIKIRYHVAGDMWIRQLSSYQRDLMRIKNTRHSVAVHGTNWEVGGIQMTDHEFFPDRAYAYEMAMNGYVCIAPDHFGFGDTLQPPKEESQRIIFKGFFEKYPQSSIDSRQILGFIRALDVLDQLPYTDIRVILQWVTASGERPLYTSLLWTNGLKPVLFRPE